MRSMKRKTKRILARGGVHRSLLLSVLFVFGFYLTIRFGGRGKLLLLENVLGFQARPPETDYFTEEASASSGQDLITEILTNIPNLPILSLKSTKHPVPIMKKKCSSYPSAFDIAFNNMYWQKLETSNGTFYLYSAYYDNRELVKNKPVIRILGMIDRFELDIRTYCYLWFEGLRQPTIETVYEYKLAWRKKWQNYAHGLHPYLISCKIPKKYNHLVPSSVSLVENPCDNATTNLKVINNRPRSGKKENFAVCVKSLDFPHDDISVRVIEWLELLFVLGAQKVYLYDLEVHPNVSKVLNYYVKRGLADRRKLSLPGEQPNLPQLRYMYLKSNLSVKRKNEVIPINDCLYRNMYKYRYIALLDIDEVIIPKNAFSWMSLLDTIKSKAYKTSEYSKASYAVQNVYFMDSMREQYGWISGIPKYMHMLQHVYRSQNYTNPKDFVKCFHDPEHILTLHNHFPLSCLEGRCSFFIVDTKDARLQHYRSSCVNELESVCDMEYKNHVVKDTTILKYRDLLIPRVKGVLFRLGFLKH